MKKHHRSQDRRNFQSVVSSLFVICTRVPTLHSCYMRMHLSSANQKRVIFFFLHFTSVVCTIVVIAKTTEMSKNTSFQNTARPVKQFLELAALFLESLQRFRYKFSNSCVTLYWKIFHKSCWTLSDINTNKPSKVKYV